MLKPVNRGGLVGRVIKVRLRFAIVIPSGLSCGQHGSCLGGFGQSAADGGLILGIGIRRAHPGLKQGAFPTLHEDNIACLSAQAFH